MMQEEKDNGGSILKSISSWPCATFLSLIGMFSLVSIDIIGTKEWG
jgi:hypothetical protein